MRIVYMGTPDFSAIILEQLAAHHDIVAVYTRPDAVRSRGKKPEPSPVKEVAERFGIPVETPKTLRSEEAFETLSSYAPDVICVAAYGAILPKEVLDLPPYGCLNTHASLLPKWRGAAPIERAILAGDEEVGVCIMRMEEGLDTGAWCVRRSIPVADRNVRRITEELADLSAQAMLTALVQIENGNAKWVEQDENQATYANKIEKGELDISPEQTVVTNLRKVRASSDAHPSKCNIAGKSVRIIKASVPSEGISLSAGEAIYDKKRLLLGCSDGVLQIIEIKPDGKRAMDAASFVAGVQDLHGKPAVWGAYNA